MQLSIVIVNWNSIEHLKRCIPSILAGTRTVSYEIVVIDSGSFDGCARLLAECYPQVRFLQSSANLGFAKANNVAFEESVGSSVLFLNPDTEVADGAIDIMYDALTSLPDAGIVGCKLLNDDGTPQSSCVQSLPTILNQALNSNFLRKHWPNSSWWGTAALYDGGMKMREVQAISGACLMMRRGTFEQVGRFTDDYFMYVEDIDLSYKVRRAGFKVCYVPNASVTHYGGSSSSQAVSTFAAVMMPEAIWRFLKKTRGPAYAGGYRLAMLGSALGRLTALAVAAAAGGRTAAWGASWRKWQAVLRWSTYRDDVVRRYYTVAGGKTAAVNSGGIAVQPAAARLSGSKQ